MVTIRTTKNDWNDEFTYTCKDDDGKVINLTAVDTVKIYIGRFNLSTLLVDAGSCTIDDAVNGIVSHVFAENVLTEGKYYDAQIEINWTATGKKRLKPFTLHVMPAL